MGWHCGHISDSFFLQSNWAGQSIFSEVPVSSANRLAMSGLWLDASVLSIDSSASDRRLQTKSAVHVDAAVHRVWLSWLHAQRHHWPAPKTSFHSVDLSLDVAWRDDFLLDFSEHAVVSVRLMNSDPAVRIAMS